MDDQRQAGGAGRRDVGAEAPFLRLARAVLIEIVEPRLAQRHDLGMPGQFDQLARGNAVFLIGLMRMGPDRAIDIGKSPGDFQERAEPPHPGRDRDHAPDPGGGGATDQGVEIVGKIRKIEMAVAVDQHGGEHETLSREASGRSETVATSVRATRGHSLSPVGSQRRGPGSSRPSGQFRGSGEAKANGRASGRAGH